MSLPHPFVVGLALVKNEEDIIEPFVRHNLQFVDLLFVGDNMSSDRTSELLQRLRKEGLPLVVFEDPVRGYAQASKMLVLCRQLAAKVFPDFIVPLDADEFIDCPSREVFHTDLALIPCGGVGNLPMVDRLPHHGDSEQGDVPRTLTYKRWGESGLPSRKVVLRLDGASFDMVLCQGNHFALRAGHVVPGIVLPHTSLGHYPKRSAEQLNTKIVLGWLAYLAWRGDAADSGLGQHWLHEFQKIIDVGLVSTVEGELIDGISQPQHFTYTRKYPIEPRPMFSRVIADCARAFTLKGPDADVACLANNLEVAWRSTQPTDYLCYTQFLILEAGPRCNMRHAACPANARGAGERLLDVDEMVRLAIEAYQLHGFRGLVGFHYYNEPMLEFAKIYAVATRVREQVGTAQFVLWTNGTIQPDDDRMKIFQQVYCTDYVGDEARLAAYYRQYSPLVTINRPNFDSRLSPKDAIFDHHPCGRPLIECIIDAWGRMRFCCQDWRGQIVLGDVRTSSLRELLGARHRLIKEVCGGTMTDTAPTRCIRCDGRTGIATFQRQIADEAREWCKGLP